MLLKVKFEDVPDTIVKSKFSNYYYAKYTFKNFSDTSIKVILTDDLTNSNTKTIITEPVIRKTINHVKLYMPRHITCKCTNFPYWEIHFIKPGLIYLHNINKETYFTKLMNMEKN